MQNSLLQKISVEKSVQNTTPIWIIKARQILLVLIVSIAIGYLLYLAIKNGFSVGWVKLLQMLAFIVFGIIRINQVNQRDDLRSSSTTGLNFSMQVTILIALTLGVFYFILDQELLLMAIGSACAFLLPHIISTSWITFSGISQIEYGVWNKAIPDSREKTFIFFGGMPVKVKFSTEANDKNKKIFKSHAPLDKSIGDFFNQFVLIQRNNNKVEIDLLDEGHEPFGWKFYRVDLFGFRKKQLDPEMTLEESEIRNSTTIMVERVRLSDMNYDIE